MRLLLLAFLLLLTTNQQAFALDWSAGNRISFELGATNGTVVKYSFQIAENGDVRIDVKSTETKGTLLLLGGRYLAIKDVPVSKGAEIDVVDFPALMLQLVLKLLASAAPTGTEAARGGISVNRVEPKHAIRVATQSAAGNYPAPWAIFGVVNSSASPKTEFDIWFDPSGNSTTEGSTRFVGTWERAAPYTIADSTSLKGWSVYVLGPVSSKWKHGQTFEYGSSKLKRVPNSVGDLRRLML